MSSPRLNGPNLKLYLPLSKDVKDISGNHNDGIWSGTEAYTTGPFGKDVGSFNGSSAITLPNIVSIKGLSKITIACRFNITSLPASAGTIYNELTSDAGALSRLSLYVNSTSQVGLLMRDSEAGASFITSPLVPISLNTSYFICCVIDTDTDVMYLFINGKLVSSNTTAKGPFTNTLPFTTPSIAKTSLASNYFTGKISNIRLYHNIALTSQEIQDLYKLDSTNISKPIIIEKPIDTLPDNTDSSLLAAYLNKATVGSAKDYSSFARNGTATNVKWPRVGGRFDNDTSIIDTGVKFIETSSVTVSVFVNPYQYHATNYGVIITDYKFFLMIYKTGVIQVYSDGITFAVSTSTIPLNKWSHILITRSSTGIVNIYINGLLNGVENQNSGTPQTGFVNIRIGNAHITGRQLYGTIKDLRVYNRILTPTEITRIYQEGIGNLGPSSIDVITPTLNNGGFETTSSAGWTNWTTASTGNSYVAVESGSGNVYNGTYACKLYTDINGSSSYITQNVGIIGNTYAVSYYAKSDISGSSVYSNFTGGTQKIYILPTSWKYCSDVLTATGTSLLIARQSAQTASIYIDNVTVTDVTPREILFETYDGVKDLSPYRRTITNTNTKVGSNGMVFNGSNSKLDTGSDWIGTNNVTVTAWIKPSGAGGLSVGNICSNNKFEFNLLGVSSKLRFSNDGGISVVLSSVIPNFSYNKYFHVSVIRNNTNIIFYVNGILLDNTTVIGSPAAGNNVIIGNRSDQTRTFDGRIASLKVIKGILSANEIKLIYDKESRNY